MATSCYGFGAARSKLVTRAVCAMECAYEADSTLPKHWHDHPQLTMVLRGAYVEQHGGTSMACEEGTLVFRPAGDAHADRFSIAGAACLNVVFHGEEFRSNKLAPPSPRRLMPSGSIYRIRRELQTPDDLSPLVLDEVATVLFTAFVEKRGIRLDSQAPTWLERIRELVQYAFDRAPSLEQLAATAGRHPVHVAKAFLRHYGSTVGEFIRQRRLEVACYRLATTDLPVSVVAQEAGFADHSHLARTMRRFLHVRPSGFRKAFTFLTPRRPPG